MTDEIFYARRKQLTEAVKKAVLDLLAHENIPPATFEFTLDDGRTVTVSVSGVQGPKWPKENKDG